MSKLHLQLESSGSFEGTVLTFEEESLYFFKSNRWDIKTHDGTLIKLPGKDLSTALDIVYKVKNNDTLNDNKFIDLRISNHIITLK